MPKISVVQTPLPWLPKCFWALPKYINHSVLFFFFWTFLKTGSVATPQNVASTHHISASAINVYDGNLNVPTFLFNKLYFKKPSVPLLYQWRDVDPEEFCHIGNYTNCDQTSCQCIHTIKVKLNEVSTS